MVTFRQLNAVRTALSNARDVCTDQHIIAALHEAIDELDAMIQDVLDVDEEHAQDLDALREHVTSGPASAATLDLFDFGVTMARMQMGCVS